MPIQGDAAPALPTYTNISPLGTQGAQSYVYLAHHEGFDKPCVQKVVRPVGQPGKLAFPEPRLLDQLRHPRIVPVLDTQYDPHTPGAVVFVMPYFKSGSVRFALEQGYRFSLHQAIDVVCDQLAALGHVHAQGFIDRDMKAANVLLSDDMRRGFLSDIGLAVKIEKDGRVPGNAGTPIYMPPECFGPNGRVGPSGDIFGVGFTLFELVNGPLDYNKIDYNKVIARLGRGRRGLPDSVLEFEPQVPAELRRVVMRALRVDPATRYQDARSLTTMLRRIECIDWREVSRGPNMQGEWEGTWPPRLAVARRRTFKVTVNRLRSSQLRVEAYQKATPAAKWRRFGVSPIDIASRDARALSQVFSAVRAYAAHVTAMS